MVSRNGHIETVRTLVELGVDKEAKDNVRNLMTMIMMMIMMVMVMMMMVMIIIIIITIIIIIS